MCVVVVVTVVCLSAVKVHIDQSAQPRNGGAIASSEERERAREREREYQRSECGGDGDSGLSLGAQVAEEVLQTKLGEVVRESSKIRQESWEWVEIWAHKVQFWEKEGGS
jgi:hypothetical protein